MKNILKLNSICFKTIFIEVYMIFSINLLYDLCIVINALSVCDRIDVYIRMAPFLFLRESCLWYCTKLNIVLTICHFVKIWSIGRAYHGLLHYCTSTQYFSSKYPCMLRKWGSMWYYYLFYEHFYLSSLERHPI